MTASIYDAHLISVLKPTINEDELPTKVSLFMPPVTATLAPMK